MVPLTFLSALLVMLFGAVGCTLIGAVSRRNVAAVVNTLFSLLLAGVTLPFAVGTPLPWIGTVIAPELTIWVTVAGLLHSIGMLGPYDSVWWWDHLTHTVSAALVAALAYAGFLAAFGDVRIAAIPLTIGYVMLAGVFWELIELLARIVGKRYGIEPVLVQYGPRDAILDLVFDLVGALLVVTLEVDVFRELAGHAPATAGSLLYYSAVMMVMGSALLVVILGLLPEHETWGR
ncbi:hypothetical protein ACERIT_03750 [Halopenitus sp. H-Gu1]|uniref:hypothetical protein n=1 Tax=Halopenitus sp. H-Gu1 TaxID=3242697 RepID=UPI00359CEE12